MKTTKIVTTAALSALIFVVTAFLQIPMGVGYFNFGDAFLFVSVVLMGPWWGCIAGAVGGSVADLTIGFAVYAPFTVVIKATEGIICGLIIDAICKKQNRNHFWGVLCAFLSGVTVMFCGYFVANSIMLKSVPMAFTSLPFDILQGVVSVIVGLCLCAALLKIPYVRQTFKLKLQLNNPNNRLIESKTNGEQNEASK